MLFLAIVAIVSLGAAGCVLVGAVLYAFVHRNDSGRLDDEDWSNVALVVGVLLAISGGAWLIHDAMRDEARDDKRAREIMHEEYSIQDIISLDTGADYLEFIYNDMHCKADLLNVNGDHYIKEGTVKCTAEEGIERDLEGAVD